MLDVFSQEHSSLLLNIRVRIWLGRNRSGTEHQLWVV